MIDMVEIGPAERDLFDAYVEESPGADFRQLYGWGEVRTADGWAARRFLARRNGGLVGAASVLMGRLPHLPFRVLHVPCGPVIDYHSPELTAAFADLLRRLARESSADLVRIDPPLLAQDTDASEALAAAGFLPSALPWSFWNGPREVLRIDLGPDEHTLYRRMKRNKRQHVSGFARRGFLVRTEQELKSMLMLHSLLRGLGGRKGFVVRAERYWHALWSEFALRGRAALYLAQCRSHVIGGMLTLRCGRTSYALHAADMPSADCPRPNAALYWAALVEARGQGCTTFDMLGYVNSSHLRYKLSLGGELVKLGAYHELAGRPVRRALFSLVEQRVLPWAVPLAARLSRTRAGADAPVARGSAD